MFRRQSVSFTRSLGMVAVGLFLVATAGLAVAQTPGSEAPLTSRDEGAIRFFDREYRSYMFDLEHATPQDLQNAATRENYGKRIKKLEETLASVQNRNNPEYRRRAEQLAAFKARVEELSGTADEQTGALGDIDEQIALFRAEIPETYSAELVTPHPEGQRLPTLPSPNEVRSWIERIVAMKEIIERGGEYFNRVKETSDRFQHDEALQRYVNWFTRYLPRNFKREVEGSVERWPLIVRDVARLQPEDVTRDRLLMRGWAKDNLELNALGQAAAENLRLYRSQYLKDSNLSDLDAQTAHLKKMERLIRDGYADALKDVRLPAAVSNDAGLLATAKRLLAADGVTGYRSLRINYNVTRKRDTRWYEGRLWVRVWDEFQCAAARKIDGEPRIVFYNFRKDHQNVGNTNLGTWYYTGPITSTPILESNIERFGGDDPGW